jgi:hypothetical protein
MEAFCVIVVIIVVIVIFISISVSSDKQNRIDILKKNYADSLDLLRSDPTNPTYHEQALQAGRYYSSATRNNKGVTLFDETALANDIRAVTANASQIALAQQQLTAEDTKKQSLPDNQSVAERIATLKMLKEADMISDEEYESKRKAILDSI